MPQKNILAVVLIVAVVGFLAWRFMGKEPTEEEGATSETDATSAQKAKAPVKMASLAKMAKKLKDEEYFYDQEVSKEVKDPLESMKRYEARKKKEEEEAAWLEEQERMKIYDSENPLVDISSLDLMTLNAIIYDAQGSSLAIIDHSLVREGYLLDNGARVEEIDSDSVKVSLSGEERNLLLEQEY